MNFIKSIENELNEEKCYTENGATAYKTSGSKLPDINFSVSSLRNMTCNQVYDKFMDAYYENPRLAIKWLFYCRDVRGGLGERRTFRIIINHLAYIQPKLVDQLVEHIAHYGRYDDLLCLLDTPVKSAVLNYIENQIYADLQAMPKGESISLIGKWLPSFGASSSETKRYAKIIANHLNLSEKPYRKLLTKLRRYIDIVESKMSANLWSEIDYSAVPSRANLIYGNAFLKRDEYRRVEYLKSLSRGETKINAGVLYPHDIIHRYIQDDSATFAPHVTYNDTMEELWKALSNSSKTCGNILVVGDGSGSMLTKIGNTNISALEVANALEIYFAERCSGPFKNKYITFSNKPQLVDLSGAKNLLEKILKARRHNEIANTNIEETFKLILKTAVKYNMSQEDMPEAILIISDMEFDHATTGFVNKTLFENIRQDFESKGYKVPRLVFWNVNSRTCGIPIKENDLGVTLVSGFSVNIIDMVMSDELDPYKCLVKVLESDRYQPIEQVLKNFNI